MEDRRLNLTLLLRCNDIDETRSFYENVLGFRTFGSSHGTLTVVHEEARLVFTDKDLWQGPPRCTGTVYFTVANVDDFFATLSGRAAFEWGLEDMSYGSREFAIRDCNGYVLAFQQAVQPTESPA